MSPDHTTTLTAVPRVRGEIVGIQYLRGIAAMMVVVYHLEPQLRRMGYEGPWLPGLSSGVDIFFVVSGFIMWMTTCDKPISPIEFWWKRIVRIVPLYWLITSFMVVLMLMAPKLLQTSTFELGHVLSSFLFVAYHHPIKEAIEPVVMPGWTLNYEMFFYLIFGLTLLVRPWTRFIATGLCLLFLTVLGEILRPDRVSIAGFYTSSIMLEFLAGMALGLLMTRTDFLRRGDAWLGWTCVALGFIAVLLPWPTAVIPLVYTRGIPAAFIVAGVLVVEANGRMISSSLLHQLGDASYSIYLSQLLTMSAASQAWRKLHLTDVPLGLVMFSLLATAICAIAGVLCCRYIEQPLSQYLSRRPRDGVMLGRGARQSGDLTGARASAKEAH